MCAFRSCPKTPHMDTENTPSLAAPCEFLETDHSPYGRGDFHAVSQRKTVPTAIGPIGCAFSMSGFHWGQESISVCTIHTDSSGALIVISCRDMTGAFELISIVCFLSLLA
jgi:hypothetical protein